MMSWLIAIYVAISPLTGISGLYVDHLSNVFALCLGVGLLVSRGGWIKFSDSRRLGVLLSSAGLVGIAIAIGWLNHSFSPMDPYRALLFFLPVIWLGLLEPMDAAWWRMTLRRMGWIGGGVAIFCTLVLANFDPALGKFKPRVEDWLLGSNHLSFYLVFCVLTPFLLAWRVPRAWNWLILLLPIAHLSKTHLLVYMPIVAACILHRKYGWKGIGILTLGGVASLAMVVSTGDSLESAVPESMKRSLGNLLMGVRVAGNAIESGKGLDVLSLMGDVGGRTRVVIYQTFFDNWESLWLSGLGNEGAKALFGNRDFHSLYFFLISNYGIIALAGFLTHLVASVFGSLQGPRASVIYGLLAYGLARVGFITIDPVRFLVLFTLFAVAARSMESKNVQIED